MRWLALRFALRGGREAAIRLIVIATGVSLGVVLLLAALASFSALHAQDVRTGWLQTSTQNHRPNRSEASADPLKWLSTHDNFGSQAIQRIDLAATGPRSPLPPGISALPGSGQFYASPAMARLIARTPPDQLGARYPGRQAGLIGRAALASPDSLVIIVGNSVDQLAPRPGVITVRSIEAAPTPHSLSTFQEVALGLGAAALLVPILTLIAMATRIAAARREQRLASLRLVGATIGQVALLAAVEAVAAAALGAVAGVGLFYLVRSYLAQLRFTGLRWYPGDLNLGALEITAVCVGVPLAAAAAAVAALRRVQLSPLGVVRAATPAPPTIKRLIPLGIGLLVLTVFALAGHPYDRGASSSYAPTIVAGFVLVMIGIVAGGPWLTMASTRLLPRRRGRAATLIARRRVADQPAAAFRSVSGLILAVFVGSVFVAGTATASRGGTAIGDDQAAARTAITTANGPPLTSTAAANTAAHLRSLPGVSGIAVIHAFPTAEANGFPQVLLECRELASTPEIGRCPTGSHNVIMPLYSLDAGHTQPGTIWAAADDSAGDANRLPARAIVVTTDGNPATLERVRTSLDNQDPHRLSVPVTLGQLSAASIRDAAQLQHLGDLAILLSVIIAGASLAIAVAGSLVERRRPFALLRLTGISLTGLRNVILLESAIPLLALTLVSAASGLLTAELLLRAVRGATIRLPPAPYYFNVLIGVVIALALVLSTMPLLRRISDPENARTE